MSPVSAVHETGIQLIIEKEALADSFVRCNKSYGNRASGVIDDRCVFIDVVTIEASIVEMGSTEANAVQQDVIAGAFEGTSSCILLIRLTGLTAHDVEYRDLVRRSDFLWSSSSIVDSVLHGFSRRNGYLLQG